MITLPLDVASQLAQEFFDFAVPFVGIALIVATGFLIIKILRRA
jgi:hypothetical protein